jgi:hypothetical protein
MLPVIRKEFQIETLEGAKRALATLRNALYQAQTVPEAETIRYGALRVGAFVRVARDRALMDETTEIFLRAQFRAGEILVEMRERGERQKPGDASGGNSRTKRPLTQPALLVEDVKAKSKPTGKHASARHWNVNFSPLKVGKNWFYDELRKIASVKLCTYTSTLRDLLGLKKAKQKSAQVFESHCVDSWVLANSQTGGHKVPDNTRLLYVTPLRWHRRRLHMLQPGLGGVRRRDGGTHSLGFKRGAFVFHPRWGLSYVGGTSKGRISLHSIETGQRITHNAHPMDCRIRSHYNSWRTCLLPAVNSRASGALVSQ